MIYDNDRDRNSYGYDAGTIVSGTVVQDPDTKEYVILDDDGKAFSSQSVLKDLVGKKIRLTTVTFDAIDNITNMIRAAEEASKNKTGN